MFQPALTITGGIEKNLFKYIEFWRGTCILHVMSANNQLVY